MRTRKTVPFVVAAIGAVLACLTNVSRCTAQPVQKPAPPASAPPQLAPAQFFPFGVYWPWETTVQIPAAEKEEFLKTRLDDLKAHNVNLVWTTNGPDTVEELGMLCRLADARGIKIVAGSGHWLMDTSAAHEDWIPGAMAMLRKCWNTLEGKPRPLAFTISDEPQPAWMDLFSQYAKQVADAGIPATTVVQQFATDKALDTNGARTMPFLACDIYPFYGSTYGPRGDTSYHFYTTYMRSFARKAHASGVAPWCMAQVYQEVWGPARQEANGQITALAGSVQHWVMPTPAQVRWQTWVSVALGARGMVYFTYGLTHFKADPQAKLVWPVPGVTDRDKEVVLKADRPTGGPLSLVSWPQWQAGPQYEAMSSSYTEIKPLVPLLQKLEPTEDLIHLAKIDEPVAGDIVGLLSDRQSREIYLAVVASPKRRKNALPIILSGKIKGLQAVKNAPRPDFAAGWPTTLALQPGQGAIYKLELDEPTVNQLLPGQPLALEADANGLVQLQGPAHKGDLVQLLRAPETGQLFVRIVSSFEAPNDSLTLALGAAVTKMEALQGSPPVKLKTGRGAAPRKVVMTLAPGMTAMYRLSTSGAAPNKRAESARGE